MPIPLAQNKLGQNSFPWLTTLFRAILEKKKKYLLTYLSLSHFQPEHPSAGKFASKIVSPDKSFSLGPDYIKIRVHMCTQST